MHSDFVKIAIATSSIYYVLVVKTTFDHWLGLGVLSFQNSLSLGWLIRKIKRGGSSFPFWLIGAFGSSPTFLSTSCIVGRRCFIRKITQVISTKRWLSGPSNLQTAATAITSNKSQTIHIICGPCGQLTYIHPYIHPIYTTFTSLTIKSTNQELFI